jgi:NADPH-dependent curcumin reductase CurA
LLGNIEETSFANGKVNGGQGDQKKIHFLERELKLHGLIDSKESSEQFINEALSQFCPDGIDFVFDNDGGPILDDIPNHINTRARIVTCDLSSYHDKKASSIQWPKNYIKLRAHAFMDSIRWTTLSIHSRL